MTSSLPVDDPRQWLGCIPQTLHRSALYSHLYARLGEDQAILSLLAQADKDQPILILFFSVVNFLVLRERQHPYAQFYPYLTPSPRPASEAYPVFREFCLDHREEICSLLPAARLQTNEVTRCATLLPAFELVSQRCGRQPLALIEIGASAGLNLNWQHYGYRYEEALCSISYRSGNAFSPVQIRCTLEGEHLPPLPPPLPHTLPAMAQCQGIELFPLDLSKETDVRWLRACIWPEERERYRLLDAALAVARQFPPSLLAGEASELLPDLLRAVPAEQPICLWHSFALSQGPARVRAHIEQSIAQASASRTIFRLSLEVEPAQPGRNCSPTGEGHVFSTSGWPTAPFMGSACAGVSPCGKPAWYSDEQGQGRQRSQAMQTSCSSSDKRDGPLAFSPAAHGGRSLLAYHHDRMKSRNTTIRPGIICL